jgi:hypothetical protein
MKLRDLCPRADYTDRVTAACRRSQCQLLRIYTLSAWNIHKAVLFSFQVAPQLYSRGWMDPVPDPMPLRKSGSEGNRTRASGSVARNYDHYTIEVVWVVHSVIYLYYSPLSWRHILIVLCIEWLWNKWSNCGQRNLRALWTSVGVLQQHRQMERAGGELKQELFL